MNDNRSVDSSKVSLRIRKVCKNKSERYKSPTLV